MIFRRWASGKSAVLGSGIKNARALCRNESCDSCFDVHLPFWYMVNPSRSSFIGCGLLVLGSSSLSRCIYDFVWSSARGTCFCTICKKMTGRPCHIAGQTYDPEPWLFPYCSSGS